MRILWAGPALRELEEALDYIARDDRGASDRLGHKLHAAVGRLARVPDLGRMVPEVEDPTLREIVEPAFRVMYERHEEVVRILAVLRAERDPDLGEIQGR